MTCAIVEQSKRNVNVGEDKVLLIYLVLFYQIFLGKIVSHIAPSYQVVGSENHSALSRDPDQVRPSCSSFCWLVQVKKKKQENMFKVCDWNS